MLRISVSEEAEKVRITVEGELVGDVATVLRENWENAALLRRSRPVRVDLCGVTSIDAIGRDVLRLMIEDGAELIASGPKTAYIVETLRANSAGSR